MRIVTYKCDLCRQEKPESELIGYKWDAAGPVQLKPHKAVNHICKQCVQAVAQMREIV